MKFLFFASALAILSSASAHDAEENQRRRISTGSAIHFSEQVDDALKLIVKGTNSKAVRSPIQQLIYNKDGEKEGSKGGGDKGDKEDKEKDSDDDRKGGGNKESSSSGDRKGGRSSSSSSNDKGRSSSSSSSSGDSSSAATDICDLGHNACDHENEKKGRKGSDPLATKLECDIACSTLCGHDDREHMGCPPVVSSSSTSTVALKGAEQFSGAAKLSPIQQLIYRDDDGGDDSKGGSDKENSSDDDRKGGGGDGKSSSSSSNDKGRSSSSSSSNDKGGSSSSGEASSTSLCESDLDCGPGTTTQLLCDAVCGLDSDCTLAEKDVMNCPDVKRAWKNGKYVASPNKSSSSSSSSSECGNKKQNDPCNKDDDCDSCCCMGSGSDMTCRPLGQCNSLEDSLTYVLKGQNYMKSPPEENKSSEDSKDDKNNKSSSSSSSSSKSSGGTSSTGNSAASDDGGVCDIDCTGPDKPVGCGVACEICTDPSPPGCPQGPPPVSAYVLKGQNYKGLNYMKKEEDDAEDSKDDKNNKSSSSSSSSKSSGGTSSTGNSAASADDGGVCDVDCTPGPDRPVGCGELCKVCTDPIPTGCPPNPPSVSVKNLRGLKNY